MNIAIGGLVLLLLFLPGFAFRTILIKSDSLENPLDASKLAELTLVTISSLIIHTIGLWLTEKLTCYDVKLNQLYYLIAGNNESTKKLNVDLIEESIIPFSIYILLTIIISGIIGKLLQGVILQQFLDLEYTLLPVTNEWDNLLSGRLHDYETKQEIERINQKLKKESEEENIQRLNEELQKLKQSSEVDFIELNVLVNSSGKNVLYTGTLNNYFLAKGNTLDKIYLTDVVRKEINDSKEEEPPLLQKSYEFPEGTLVLKNSDIVNINVKYKFITLEE